MFRSDLNPGRKKSQKYSNYQNVTRTRTTLNCKSRNIGILMITWVLGSNPLRIRTKVTQTIYYQHVLQDISAPRTRINLSFAALKTCFQSASFEYNDIIFEDKFFLTPRRAMWKLQRVLTRGLEAKISKKMCFIYLIILVDILRPASIWGSLCFRNLSLYSNLN